MSFFSSLKGRLADSTLSQLWQKPPEGEQKPSFIGRLNNIFVSGFAGNSDSSSSRNSTALKQVSQNLQLSESDIKAHLQREAGREQFGKVAVFNLNETTPSPEIPPEQRVFKTNGGEWRKSASDDAVRFYRTGEDTSGTNLFDEEYYRPDPAKYPQADGKWIRLNPNGDMRDLPEYKGKPQPENISDFDWKGFEWVDASQVPASYTTEGKTLVFAADGRHIDAERALLKYIEQNLATPEMWGVHKQNILEEAKQKGVKAEILSINETSNGERTVSINISSENLAKLRQISQSWANEAARETNAGAEGQNNALQMATDVPKVFANAAINTVNGITSTATEIAAVKDPGVNAVKHIIKEKLEIPRMEYGSDYMNRDITGKVNPDGITTGKVAEVAVELSAPVVIGNVTKPVTGSQTLKSVGALPETESATVVTKTTAINETTKLTETKIVTAVETPSAGTQPIQTIKNKFPNEPLPTATSDKAKIIGVAEIVNGKVKVNGQLPRYVDFVVDMNGNLILGNRHHLLGNAGDVQAAGIMKINKGKIAEITNLSGHYQPSVKEAMKFPEILRGLGLDLSRTHFRVVTFEPTSSGNLARFPVTVHREFLK